MNETVEDPVCHMQVSSTLFATEYAGGHYALSIGADLGGGWMDRLKLAFTNYLEETEMNSLEVENKKCCHR